MKPYSLNINTELEQTSIMRGTRTIAEFPSLAFGMAQYVCNLLNAADATAQLHNEAAWMRRHEQAVGTIELREADIATLRGMVSEAYAEIARLQDRWVNHWPLAQQAWERGEWVRKVIGYDAGETRRAMAQGDEKYELWYPLIEWGFDRDACIAAIAASGLAEPPKSACFFCPASRKEEIVALQREHPDLYQRAVAMEENAAANLGSVKGLGRRFAWSSLTVEGAEVSEAPEIPCDCFDGEAQQC